MRPGLGNAQTWQRGWAVLIQAALSVPQLDAIWKLEDVKKLVHDVGLVLVSAAPLA